MVLTNTISTRSSRAVSKTSTFLVQDFHEMDFVQDGVNPSNLRRRPCNEGHSNGTQRQVLSFRKVSFVRIKKIRASQELQEKRVREKDKRTFFHSSSEKKLFKLNALPNSFFALHHFKIRPFLTHSKPFDLFSGGSSLLSL